MLSPRAINITISDQQRDHSFEPFHGHQHAQHAGGKWDSALTGKGRPELFFVARHTLGGQRPMFLTQSPSRQLFTIQAGRQPRFDCQDRQSPLTPMTLYSRPDITVRMFSVAKEKTKPCHSLRPCTKVAMASPRAGFRAGAGGRFLNQNVSAKHPPSSQSMRNIELSEATSLWSSAKLPPPSLHPVDLRNSRILHAFLILVAILLTNPPPMRQTIFLIDIATCDV